MSTLSISDKLTVYGTHAMGSLGVSFGMCRLTQKIKAYFLPKDKGNISKYLIPGAGFLAGVATSAGIASSPMLQKIAVSAVIGGLGGGQAAAVNQAQIGLIVDRVGPYFKSLSAIFCGVTGAVLGCWISTFSNSGTPSASKR